MQLKAPLCHAASWNVLFVLFSKVCESKEARLDPKQEWIWLSSRRGWAIGLFSVGQWRKDTVFSTAAVSLMHNLIWTSYVKFSHPVSVIIVTSSCVLLCRRFSRNERAKESSYDSKWLTPQSLSCEFGHTHTLTHTNTNTHTYANKDSKVSPSKGSSWSQRRVACFKREISNIWKVPLNIWRGASGDGTHTHTNRHRLSQTVKRLVCLTT